MSWLTGKEIQKEVEAGRITIDPFEKSQVNPNSYNYRLANKLLILKFNNEFNGIPCIDPKLPMITKEVIIPETGYLLLTENFYLGSTVEVFGSDIFPSLLTGRSSIARIGLGNHKCGGLLDLGWKGTITLEISAKLPTIVYPNMKFGQVYWFTSIGDVEGYKGKYQGQRGPRASEIYKDFQTKSIVNPYRNNDSNCGPLMNDGKPRFVSREAYEEAFNEEFGLDGGE